MDTDFDLRLDLTRGILTLTVRSARVEVTDAGGTTTISIDRLNEPQVTTAIFSPAVSCGKGPLQRDDGSGLYFLGLLPGPRTHSVVTTESDD